MATFLGWAPVWLPLIFFCQIALLGLRPTRIESERLDREEARLLLRQGALEAENHRLGLVVRAHRDPIFLERERRARSLAAWPGPAHAAGDVARDNGW